MLLNNCNSDKFFYTAFGLYIMSDFLLPELLPASICTPDICISYGKVPINILNPVEKTDTYQVAKNQFLFQVQGIGRYYVTNGNRIVVNPAKRTEEHIVRLFLLGTSFGALLLQRGILPIHGSAVVINGCGVIFTGASGAGKSTLLAAFRQRGYSFLTDDVAAVTLKSDGAALVQSAYPQQKLWRDSAEEIGLDTAQLAPVYNGIEKKKYSIPVHNGFIQSPVSLVAVYELRAESCRDVTLKPLWGMDKLAVLLKHTYRCWLIKGLGLMEVYFKLCIAVARQVSVSRLTRPEGLFSLEEQVRLINQDIADCSLAAHL
ncbi:HPr kinase [Desulfofarcimen acetoxidans DSM 771]|uniref:HPr kinase n=1 Tax=Desulfofarcimen acetoxidans (strain ATCC 49208 / DSM 771 / KCTC 5769 / VKM B-1644 / 5575) TaxID=485916 RepID=C8W5L0_DESAS|nr:HPr kinase [Desulfofarcimen acetoxidans]ACV64010.1 HPr kinase [Desulfofarcimen acetoxidans DSM 771]